MPDKNAILKNLQVDELTNRFHRPLAFKVSSVKDLKALRRAWLERDSIPCLIGRREDAIDNSFLGLDIRTFLSGDDSSGRVSAHDIIVAPGSGLPRHYQTEGEFYLAVIEGEIELTVGELTDAARAGSFAYIPAHTTAAIENKSKGPARLYLVTCPAGVDRAFSEAHALWAESGEPAEAAYLAILERYGFCFGEAGPQQNDARANMKSVRMEADIGSPDDFEAMRQNWNTRRPIPKFLPSPEGADRLSLESDAGSASSDGKVVVSGDETSGHAVMFAGEAGPHYSAFPHYQPTEEELFYVVSGDLELTCGSQTLRILPGAFGFAPRSATHGFMNPQSQAATRIITFNSPAGHERGFEMIARHQRQPYRNLEAQMRSHGWEARDIKDLETLTAPS